MHLQFLNHVLKHFYYVTRISNYSNRPRPVFLQQSRVLFQAPDSSLDVH